MANSIDRRFDILKQKAAQDVRGQQQEAEKGLTRQFARLGGIGTGAFVKQQALAKEAGSRRLQEAQQGIEFQRLGEQQRQEDISAQRAFQTAERLGSQEFAKGERVGSQSFAAKQAELQRKYQTGERVSSQEFQQGLFDVEQKNTLSKLDLAKQQFGMEQNVNYLNAKLQVAEGMKKGLFGFDDLNALGALFGKPEGFTTTGTGSGGPKGQNMSVEGLSELRSSIQARSREPLAQGAFTAGAHGRAMRKIAIDEGKKRGLSEQDLIRAGVI